MVRGGNLAPLGSDKIGLKARLRCHVNLTNPKGPGTLYGLNTTDDIVFGL